MNHKEVLDLLGRYEEHELFYKNYYEKKKDPQQFNSFLKTLKAQELYEKRLIVPEIIGSWMPSILNENIMNLEDTSKDIAILKHFRYTPMFNHEHSFYELIYCLSGKCEEEIDGYNFTLKEGQFCLIPPHTSHSIGVFDDSLVINIIIWRRTFEDIFYNLLRNSNIISDFFNESLYIYEQNSYMLIDTLKDDDIKNLILDMYAQSLQQKAFYNLVNTAQIIYMFSLILQNYEQHISFPYKPFDGNKQIVKMISYIEHHFKEITLEELASEFNFSVSHCSRLIKKYTNDSFTEIVLAIKFTKSKNLLENSNYTITHISEECGFNNVEHFSRLFKKRFGETPGHYRKNFVK